MPSKNSSIDSLAARKKLLLMESDLNRAHFVEAAQDLKCEMETLKHFFQPFGALASTATKVITTATVAKRLFLPRRAAAKRSWMSLLVDAVSAGTPYVPGAFETPSTRTMTGREGFAHMSKQNYFLAIAASI